MGTTNWNDYYLDVKVNYSDCLCGFFLVMQLHCQPGVMDPELSFKSITLDSSNLLSYFPTLLSFTYLSNGRLLEMNVGSAVEVKKWSS